MIAIARRKSINRETSCPSFVSKETFPAMDKSRSNQGLSSAPPYTSTATRWQPNRLTTGFGLTDRFGLSVCAPTSLKPSSNVSPTVNAIKLESLRTMKCFPPTFNASGLESLHGVKPAARRRCAIAPTAWNGVVASARKASRESFTFCLFIKTPQ